MVKRILDEGWWTQKLSEYDYNYSCNSYHITIGIVESLKHKIYVRVWMNDKFIVGEAEEEFEKYAIFRDHHWIDHIPLEIVHFIIKQSSRLKQLKAFY